MNAQRLSIKDMFLRDYGVVYTPDVINKGRKIKLQFINWN